MDENEDEDEDMAVWLVVGLLKEGRKIYLVNV